MKTSNIFYFKNIVDFYYPNEDSPTQEIKKVVIYVKENIKQLSDADFIEVLISCFIPDLYAGMGKREKLFTKLTELMVGEWWRRLGGFYNLPTKKSGTEDVELIYDSISIVCDAKVFRLGRSQKAPNVKDFLKLASVKLWIDNLNSRYHKNSTAHSVIGGLVTYSSLHEWENDSEVYEECTNCMTPVIMLPYEVLALLLEHKNSFCISQFVQLWNYKSNNVVASRQKSNYWAYVANFICELINISSDEYDAEITRYHHRILSAVQEYRNIIEHSIDAMKKKILSDLNRYSDYNSLRAYVLNEIGRRDNAIAFDYLNNIDKFRKF